jgi:hypothetical protein
VGYASGEHLGEFVVFLCCVVSSLVRFGARKVRVGFWGLPGFDRSDRRATPA